MLNVNPITPFGGQAAFNSLPQPSVKLVPGTTDQTAPMACREIVINQMQSVEANLGKLKVLPDSEETREMVQISIRLHEFVLRAYTSQALSQRLIEPGKTYATKHNINVDWQA